MTAPVSYKKRVDSNAPGGFSARFSNGLSAVLRKLKVDEVPHIRRIIVTVVGGTIVIVGVTLFLTPFPAVLVIPAGLAILGTEYAWARRWMRKARTMAKSALNRTQRIFSPRGKDDEKDADAALAGVSDPAMECEPSPLGREKREPVHQR